jgi:penicillin-binding protein 1A
VVGVFIGYDSPKHLGKGMTGGHVAAPVFANFMKMALADKKAVPFRIPPGLKLVRVSLRTGLRAMGGEGDTVTEAFKPSRSPTTPTRSSASPTSAAASSPATKWIRHAA